MTNWRLIEGDKTNSVGYPSHMAELIDEIRGVGDEIRALDESRSELLAKRKELVLKARKQGMTWRELALALGMTEHGLIKITADKKPASKSA